ncbi:helix-turn-helix transcriptional regulator [Microbacterium sp. 1P10AE]|uniref:helix-turn-helix transcriptional regulator n=1 Tax=Microbacterium sp. 1P10AE TaxID=3132286 RepID=UPI00399EF5A7
MRDDRYLSPAMVCELIPGMTLDILAVRRHQRLMPPYYKPSGNTVVYRESEIHEWVANSRVETRCG